MVQTNQGKVGNIPLDTQSKGALSIALLTKHVSLNGLIVVSQHEMFMNLVFHLLNKIRWF